MKDRATTKAPTKAHAKNRYGKLSAREVRNATTRSRIIPLQSLFGGFGELSGDGVWHYLNRLTALPLPRNSRPGISKSHPALPSDPPSDRPCRPLSVGLTRDDAQGGTMPSKFREHVRN